MLSGELQSSTCSSIITAATYNAPTEILQIFTVHRRFSRNPNLRTSKVLKRHSKPSVQGTSSFKSIVLNQMISLKGCPVETLI